MRVLLGSKLHGRQVGVVHVVLSEGRPLGQLLRSLLLLGALTLTGARKSCGVVPVVGLENARVDVLHGEMASRAVSSKA